MMIPSFLAFLALASWSSADSTCGIVQYTGPMLAGDIRINVNFSDTIDKIANVAIICNTKVNIIKSFLKESGASASKDLDDSNHYVGHAIKIELGSVVDTGYPCKHRCLNSVVMPSYAQCFVDAIQTSLGLRWANSHIDDNFATLYPQEYNQLKVQLQTTC